MRNVGWRGESYRHYLAAKGVRTGRNAYMRWKEGPLREIEGQEIVAPAFLMWRTPHQDMMEAVSDLEKRESDVSRRVKDAEIFQTAPRLTPDERDAYLKELDDIRARTRKLLDVKKHEMETGEWKRVQPTFPARASSIYDTEKDLEMMKMHDAVKGAVEESRKAREEAKETVEKIRVEERIKAMKNAEEWAKNELWRRGTQPVFVRR